MRVLHVLDSLARGGAQIIVKGLLEHQRRDPGVSLYVLRSVKDPVSIEHPKVVVNNSKWSFSPIPLFSLRKSLDRRPVDILHCHLFRSQVFGWLLKMIFFPRIKLIFHEHGRIFGSELGSALGDRLYAAFLRIASPRVDGFIAISRATRNRLIDRSRIQADKIKVLYNFVDPLFRNVDPLSHGEQGSGGTARDRDASDFRVGFAGRLVHRKGWLTFLKAADHISGKSTAFKFLMAGDGPERQRALEAIKERPFADRIIYVGQIEDMTSFYASLDCLVVPSLWEPQGLVEIEAQALGVPVVASNTEALNEIIQDGQNGLLFETDNAADLAEKILLLRSQPDLCNKLAAGGLVTSRQYDIAHYTTQLGTFYEQLSDA